MLCKVKLDHHSYFHKKRLAAGAVVDIPAKVAKDNPGFYEAWKEKEIPVAPPADRAKLQKDAVKRKLVRTDEVDRLSTDQLVKLTEAGPRKTKEDLVSKAYEKGLGAIEDLEALSEDELLALIDGA